MSNKMALDALKLAYIAMQHMGNVLNNIDAVDEEEDAQHDAAFEAVRLAIAQLEQPQKSRIVAAPMASYPEADQRFFNFWYGHMFEDLMQPPLVGIDHATARYIWNAAAIAALQAEPQGWRPIETAPVNTQVVALFRGERPVIAHKNAPNDSPAGWCHAFATRDYFDHPTRWLTHWMPLPATPPKD